MLQALVFISQKNCCRKEAWGYAKLFIIRKKRRKLRKNGQVSELSKQWVLRCLPKKQEEEMNKIAHVFLQMFPSLKREISFQGAQ